MSKIGLLQHQIDRKIKMTTNRYITLQILYYLGMSLHPYPLPITWLNSQKVSTVISEIR